MSVTRKGPVSRFWAGSLEAKLAGLNDELARSRAKIDAQSAQIRALRTALIKAVAKERRLRERLTGATHQPPTEVPMPASAYPSVLSTEPGANCRYFGFYRHHRIEVAVACGAGELVYLAYVDGREVGVYDSRNIAETAARIAIDKLEVCEIEA